jgi:hypothetical protein
MGQTQLVPYSADYFFYRANQQQRELGLTEDERYACGECQRLGTLRMHISYRLETISQVLNPTPGEPQHNQEQRNS